MQHRAAYAGTTLYVWMQILILGSLVSETVLFYPNVFHNVPASLETTLEFLQVTDPGSFFPPIGSFAILVGLVALPLVWKARTVRNWMLASLMVFIAGNFIFSVLYAWPRNVIMFEEGAAVHSAAYLQQVADEFVLGHGVRLTTSVAAAVCSFMGFLRYCRQRVLAQE